MKKQVIGLFFNPWPEKWWGSKQRPRNPFELYRRGLWYKANPRQKAYMRTLFGERYPRGQFVDVKSDGAWRVRVENAEAVILLYPDAIGLGFSGLERYVRGRRNEKSQLRILNGRRRDFALDNPARMALGIRRLLERTMLSEIVFTLFFIAVTPLFLGIDWVRGRT